MFDNNRIITPGAYPQAEDNFRAYGHEVAGFNLAGADLRGLDLVGLELQDTILDGADLRDSALGYVPEIWTCPGSGDLAWAPEGRVGESELTDEELGDKEWAMMQDIAHYHAAGVPRPGDAKINSSTSMCWNLAVYWLGVLDPRPAYDFLRDNPEWEGTLDELTEIVEGVWIWELYEEDADVLLSISADKR